MASPPLTSREFAYLRITGDGHHRFISNTLGIECTNAWNKGDINPRNERPRKFTSWQLESGLDDKEDIDDHLNELFKILEPVKEKLLQLSKNYEVCIQCVGYFPASGHGIHLDKNKVAKASEFGASFDLDFYYVSDYDHDLDYI